MVAVGPHATGLDPAAHAVGAVDVAGPEAGAEAVLGVVGDGQGLGFVLEGGDADHRAEDFLLEHAHAVVPLEQGRLDVVAAGQVAFELLDAAAGEQLGAFLLGDVEVGEDLLVLLLGSLGADHGLGVQRVAALDRPDLFQHLFHEPGAAAYEPDVFGTTGQVAGQAVYDLGGSGLPCRGGPPPTELSLEEAIERILCHDPQTRLAWANAKAQAAQVGIGKSAYLPRLDGRLDASRGYSDMDYRDAPYLSGDGHRHRRGASLQLSWVLFDFGRRSAALRNAQQLLLAANASQDATLQNTFALAANVIADAKTKVYGDADPSLTYQVSGLKNGDTAGSILTGGLNRAAGENVGVYGINQGDLALNSGNYDLSYQGNNLTITKALLNVIADAKTKVYGDADPSLTYQVSGLKNGDTAGAVLNGGSLSRVAGENVGVYGINQGDLALNSGNYDLSYQGNNLTITKALLNVIADAKTKVYGDADPSREREASIEIQGLRYRYAEQEPWVLDGLDLRIAGGESVAIVGPSGCGKSTLFNVLLGILPPVEGQIRMAGLDLAQLGLDGLRELVGTVLQDDVLFAGSLSDNISFFDPQPDMPWLLQCAQMAAIHDDIQAMPMGYNTLVGDMGTVLSGGQKQRVMLARALYKKPRILFLDEATSHLDVHCEQRVNAAIRWWPTPRGCAAGASSRACRSPTPPSRAA